MASSYVHCSYFDFVCFGESADSGVLGLCFSIDWYEHFRDIHASYGRSGAIEQAAGVGMFSGAEWNEFHSSYRDQRGVVCMRIRHLLRDVRGIAQSSLYREAVLSMIQFLERKI